MCPAPKLERALLLDCLLRVLSFLSLHNKAPKAQQLETAVTVFALHLWVRTVKGVFRGSSLSHEASVGAAGNAAGWWPTALLGPGAVSVSWHPACAPSVRSTWASLQDSGLRTSDFVLGDQLWRGTSSSRLTPGTGTASSLPCASG